MRIVGNEDIVISKGTNNLVEEQRWPKKKNLPSIAPKGFFIATRLCHILAYILKEQEKNQRANVECFFCDTCHFLFIVLFIHFKDSNSSSRVTSLAQYRSYCHTYLL